MDANMGIQARETAKRAREYMANDTDHGSFCVVPNAVVKHMCEAIEALTADQGRTLLPVNVANVYHEVLSFETHCAARKDSLRVGDTTEADKQGHEAGEAWRRLQEALGLK